ncbi:MAG: beta-propeller domain-containing protein [Pyrinomonadaceae bacterium]
MKRSFIAGAVVLAAGVFAFSYSGVRPTGWFADLPSVASSKPRKTMQPFKSEAELKEHFKKFQESRRRAGQISGQDADKSDTANSSVMTDAAPSPSAGAKTMSASKDGKEESITNNQHAGVDEGGIVKVHGDHLVILRRGRLFTVKVGGNALEPESSVNAYPPGINPSNDWYDEMLVSGDTVVVIGYSYGRGGTEINLFDINRSGDLAYRSTYHLRSNDYYSSRNYASRLIGNKLVFYTPQYLGYYSDGKEQFPAVRKWHKRAKASEFEPVVSPTEIYRAERPVDSTSVSALHTITVCDLSSKTMACKGTAVLGAAGRVFYVSQKSVYVWTTDYNYGGGGAKSNSLLYKMPLDGSAPSALGVTGSPIDQFSFLESEGEQLNVLVRSDGRGDQMWDGEKSSGDIAMLTASAESFSDGSESAVKASYRDLPNVDNYTFQNRFVGDYMLYGTGSGWGRQETRDGANLFAANWKTGSVTNLHLNHNVDRIEPLGDAAVVVGTNGSDLYFSPVGLDDGAKLWPSYVRKNASQGELRSHGFFYKPDGDDSGLLGLPIAREGRSGYRHLSEDSAAIIFLKNNRLNFSEIGELEARSTDTNDGCRASCVDWYGNARPIFLRGRIFALMGYELVEGRLSKDRLREVRRVNYTPQGWWPNDDRSDEEEE